MNVHFILVEPIVPENVGASARAIKTMGFSSLFLVNSRLHLEKKALWLAHGANDILDNARLFPTLAEAIKGMDLVIGTTAKHRTVKHGHYPGPEIKKLFSNKGNAVKEAAIIFGREDTGLRNKELAFCDVITGIPMEAPYPSLNLSQAVMLFAWLLSPHSGTSETQGTPGLPNDSLPPAGMGKLKGKITQLFEQTGNASTSRFYKKLMERMALLGRRDINLLHFMCEMLLGEKKIR